MITTTSITDYSQSFILYYRLLCLFREVSTGNPTPGVRNRRTRHDCIRGPMMSQAERRQSRNNRRRIRGDRLPHVKFLGLSPFV